MKKIFSLCCSLFFFLISIVLFITCKKEYSYEGGPTVNVNTTKSFTLIGAGGTCTGNILSGNYYAGTVLTSANTVQLKVHVDSVGSYNVNTTSVDGFQFTGKGSFSDTGLQTITLQAIGTPTEIGNFTFTAPVGLGCTFTVPVTKAPASIAKYILEGDPTLCSGITLAGNYTYGYKLTASNIATIVVNVLAIGNYNIATDVVNGISFSATGTFTKVGIQTVQLIGSGEPLTPSYVTLTPQGGSSSCKFTVLVPNPDPQATYVLESGFGNPNPCIYTVAGNYTAKTPLSGTNTVSVSVYVTVVGNFTIATNTVNGMSFSYTGVFTSLGTQRIILFGNGTPATGGTFSFTPQIVGPSPLGGASCAFNVTVQ